VNPAPRKSSLLKHINLKIDATYFGRWGCSIVFKEGKNVIFWHFCQRETFREYLSCFSALINLNYAVDSVTSDKHGSTISSVRYLLPSISHQYCLVHIQNRCQSLLTKKPDTKAGTDLLEFVKFINKIPSGYEKQIFLKWFDRYEKRYASFLNERTYLVKDNGRNTWWYTHKNLRKAFVHLKSSISNMFFYLKDSNIPKDTNGLEAEFTHLKTKLNIHRGLKRNRRINFISWYWYQKSTQNVY